VDLQDKPLHGQDENSFEGNRHLVRNPIYNVNIRSRSESTSSQGSQESPPGSPKISRRSSATGSPPGYMEMRSHNPAYAQPPSDVKSTLDSLNNMIHTAPVVRYDTTRFVEGSTNSFTREFIFQKVAVHLKNVKLLVIIKSLLSNNSFLEYCKKLQEILTRKLDTIMINFMNTTNNPNTIPSNILSNIFGEISTKFLNPIIESPPDSFLPIFLENIQQLATTYANNNRHSNNADAIKYKIYSCILYPIMFIIYKHILQLLLNNLESNGLNKEMLEICKNLFEDSEVTTTMSLGKNYNFVNNSIMKYYGDYMDPNVKQKYNYKTLDTLIYLILNYGIIPPPRPPRTQSRPLSRPLSRKLSLPGQPFGETPMGGGANNIQYYRLKYFKNESDA
jgi:hypothetical protein